jgi:hypothetical protein
LLSSQVSMCVASFDVCLFLFEIHFAVLVEDFFFVC